MGLTTRDSVDWVAYLACAVAPISILGSIMVITVVMRTRRMGNPHTTYHRLLMGISIMDIISSTALSFGPVPIPREVGGFGTIATCAAQGFLVQFGLGSFCYSAMLMVYFLLVIRYNCSDSFIARRIEPFLHMIPIVLYSVMGIVGLQLKIFNPRNFNFCSVDMYPHGCDENPEIPCERGEGKTLPFGLFSAFCMFFSCLCICFCMLLVVCTVASRFRASSHFRLEDAQMDRKLRQVITQCLLYGVWFFCLTSVVLVEPAFAVTNRQFISDFGELCYFIILLVVFPSQGFVNFLICLRPFYLGIRRNFRSEGRWFAFKEAIWFPGSRSSDRANRSSRNVTSNKDSKEDAVEIQFESERTPSPDSESTVPPPSLDAFSSRRLQQASQEFSSPKEVDPEQESPV